MIMIIYLITIIALKVLSREEICKWLFSPGRSKSVKEEQTAN